MKKIVTIIVGFGMTVGVGTGLLASMSLQDADKPGQDEPKPITPNGSEYSDFKNAKSCMNDNSGVQVISSELLYNTSAVTKDHSVFGLSDTNGRLINIDLATCEFVDTSIASGKKADNVIDERWLTGVHYISDSSMYALSYTTGTLVKIDPLNNIFSKIGNSNADSAFNGGFIAFEYVSDTEAYTIDVTNGVLIGIKPKDGTFERVGNGRADSAIDEAWYNLTYVSSTEVYALSSNTGTLVRINPQDGTYTTVGMSNADSIVNELWYNFQYISSTEAYALSYATGTLVRINPKTGEFTKVSDTTADSIVYGNWRTFKIFSQTLAYAISEKGKIVKINPITGEMK